MTANEQGSETEQAAQTEPTSGNEEKTFEETSMENFEQYSFKETPKEEETKETATKETKTSEEAEAQSNKRQKEERHYSKKINEEVSKKISIAEKLIEKDSDAIFDIAEEDPDLAEKLLKRKDFGASTVDELLTNREAKNADLESVTKSSVQTSKEVERLKKKLIDSELLRLREGNPDLDGELEDKFRELVQRPDFADIESTKVLGVARALLGKDAPTTTKKKSDVTSELMNAVQGSMPSASGASAKEEKSKYSKEFMRTATYAGISKEDLDKYGDL